MMTTLFPIEIDYILYAAYAVFTLAWAVHLYAALSYRKVASIARRQQQTDTNKPTCEPVSIVMAAQNQAESLRRNLPAILEQEYENFEVIVVNNASTDDTEDVLKILELRYPNLRHTFTPVSSRYVSHERLSLTIGIKSAQHQWLLLTTPECRPQSSRWITGMARHFRPGIQMVLGYTNHADRRDLFVRKAIFYRLFHQMQYLPWASRHKAYRCMPGNIAYRKDFFLSHRGFAEDINLICGTAELLVNRHSTRQNTEVDFTPDTRIVTDNRISSHLWKQERLDYMETRKHFRKTWGYRCLFNLKQISIPVFYLATAAALAWSIIQQQWYGTGAVSVLFLLLTVLKTVWFNRSCHAWGERPYYFGLWWYETRIPVWHLRSLVAHCMVPRRQFRRKAF